MMPELHVLFGAGQVGYPLAQQLLSVGKRVRIVKRSEGRVPTGSEIVLGDAADRAFCANAARGATTVYHCMNPPYNARIWAELIPRYMDNLIAAAADTSARLVVLDNLYMLGRPNGHPLNEDTPMNPCSRKGEIRARAAERLFDAHRRGEVVATAGRASDFYGPGGTMTGLGDFSGRECWPARPPTHPIRWMRFTRITTSRMLRRDWRRSAARMSNAYGKPWMLPCAPAGSLRELVVRLASTLGRELPVGQLPRWLLKTIGVFTPLMRELDEMLYQWDEPFVVDDRRFRERFQILAANVDQAARETVTWAKQHYSRNRVT